MSIAQQKVSAGGAAGGWRLVPAEACPVALRDIHRLLELAGNRSASTQVIRDDHRSVVRVVGWEGRRIVAKQPRDKNRRLWMRFLSLFRAGEAVRCIRCLDSLARHGVESLTPIAALEQRRWGMVCDSWYFYFYREGTPIAPDQVAQAAQTLSTLHRAGFRHSDPHAGNFLVDQGRIFMIDVKCQRRYGRLSDLHELMLLEKSSGQPQAPSLHLAAHRGTWRELAVRVYMAYRGARASLKRLVRRGRRSRYRETYASRVGEHQHDEKRHQSDEQDGA